MLDKVPFNQTRSYPTWREDDILPFIGWENDFSKFRFHDQLIKTDNLSK